MNDSEKQFNKGVKHGLNLAIELIATYESDYERTVLNPKGENFIKAREVFGNAILKLRDAAP